TTNRPLRLKPRFRDPRPYVYQLDPMHRTACLVHEQGSVLSAYESIFYLLSDHELDAGKLGDFKLCPPATSGQVDEQDITEGWELVFTDGDRKQLDRLRIWTDWPEERSFAGGATYRRSFEVSDQWIGRRIVLEFDAPQPIKAHRRNPSRRNTGFA